MVEDRWWYGATWQRVGNLVFIDGIFDKVKYLKILGESLKESVDKLNLPENYHSRQDNDPKHSAEIVEEWLLYNTPRTLPHSPQESWPQSHRAFTRWSGQKIKNYENYFARRTRAKNSWQSTDENITSRLVFLAENRLREVIKAIDFLLKIPKIHINATIVNTFVTHDFYTSYNKMVIILLVIIC